MGGLEIVKTEQSKKSRQSKRTPAPSGRGRRPFTLSGQLNELVSRTTPLSWAEAVDLHLESRLFLGP
jgi:hypothetical protein